MSHIEFQLPEDLSRWVSDRPWLRVRPGSPSIRIRGGPRIDLRPFPLPRGLSEEALSDQLNRLRHQAPLGSVPLVVAPYLRSDTRNLLEAAQISYLDGRGHLHLQAGPVLVHIDGRPNRTPPLQSGLGLAGVKAIQVILMETRPISVTGLAATAGISAGQSHKVLSMLEQLGFLHASGRGPELRREVVDRRRLLDWLLQQPAAKRKVPRLDVNLYARNVRELLVRVHDGLEAASIRHAVTGAAAVSLFGVGASSVPSVSVRIDPDTPLEFAAHKLGAETVARGANVVLLRDTMHLGLTAHGEAEGIPVAPEVRVFLDTLGEKRGEDLAEQFREIVLGF